MNMFKQKSTTANKYVYKRNHSDDNVARFKKSLSRLNWSEILDGVDANSDYDNFIKKNTEVYDECIPMIKSKINRKTIPQSPNILNVHDTFKLNLGIFMYRHLSNQLPPIFSTYFTKHVQTHNYPTRNAQDYSINKTKKMFSDCAIRNCGPTFWNSLDKTLKHCKATKHFINQLKSILLSEYN